MRLALHAGSFDPITCGHLSVIERAAHLFDRLVVVVAVNPGKQPLFTVEERVQMIREATSHWSNVECTSTTGYVVDLARSRGAGFLVRGVRSGTDAGAELALAQANHGLAPEIQTIFLPAHAELFEVSSSKLKQLAARGMDVSRYCPPAIAAKLKQRLSIPAHGGEPCLASK
jgi:pantetheine-phosphate adenylyltransferase